MSRVYADANETRGKAWYEYNKFRIEWSSPDRYEIVRRVGGGKYSEVFEGSTRSTASAGTKSSGRSRSLRNLAGAPNCIALLDVVRDPSRLYHSLITEYVENTDWNQLYTRLTDADIRHYMFQLLTALDFRRELRLIDWGLAEFYHPGVEYHVRVGSRHYKPPELLVGYKRYDYSLDLWSTGCMFAAMIFRKQHFFRGSDNEDQLLKIMRVLGTDRFDAYLKAYDIPFESDLEDLLGTYPARPWARFVTAENQHLASPDALVFVDRLLRFDPRERLTAAEAMAHPYFGTVRVEGTKPEALSDSGFASMSNDDGDGVATVINRDLFATATV
ncbi:kinase-like domain-containing protein [Mycena leptocephala]|nr:kinase-like domain-containing protein [Mycena leptocephala]